MGEQTIVFQLLTYINKLNKEKKKRLVKDTIEIK